MTKHSISEHFYYLTSKVLDCPHSVTDDEVVLRADPNKEGTALGQMVDRLSLAAKVLGKLANLADGQDMTNDLYRAALECQHNFTFEEVVFHVDPSKSGNAKVQLGERLDLAKQAFVNRIVDGQEPIPTLRRPRVLVVVRGGVADPVWDDGVAVEVFDWDDYNDNPAGQGGVPAHFADLAASVGVPVRVESDDGEAPKFS